VPPTGTEIVAVGTADFEDEVIFTAIAPLFGPGMALSVTVPFTPVPPITDVGFTETEATENGKTLSVAD